jgi:16S rRNA (guanine1516-N2)-methyltransferase
VSNFALWLDGDGLALFAPGQPRALRLEVDDLLRRKEPRSLLARACAAGQRPSVLDAFSGFGFDGLTLALLGCRVTTVESQPVVWLLQRDLAERAAVEVDSLCQDVWPLMQSNPETWDVVFLDPMFSVRNKRALPNRGMQYLQSMADEPSHDVESCLAAALATARRRVVLKRRLKDVVIAQPNHQLRGRAVRFDVYVKR